MVSDSVATVVKTVLHTLSSPIQTELGVLLGYGQALEMLSSSLTAINAVLKDAEDKQFSSNAIKDWLQKLKDTAYELDDILEECAYHDVESEHEGVICTLLDMVCISFLSSFHPKHACFRWETAKKMKKIRERLDQIADERNKYHLTESIRQERSTGVMPWRQSISTISEPHVYGRDEDRDEIVDFLVCNASRSDDLTVYPIVGQGGLGKTTLAKLIFNHERLKDHFKSKIWVCVSEDFSPERMFKQILAAFGQASGDTNLEALQREVKDVLQNKTYLLVLDDVWDDGQDNWEILKCVLAGGAKGASVLVTTRLSQVATIMGTVPPHELSKLSDDDCLEVFKQRAFGSTEKEGKELLDIGKEIVKKCGGVPLAAKSLGSLLRFKRMKEDWIFVRDNKLWNFPQDEKSVMPALRLSYLNLPVEVRQCFSLCALFPKDERIEKQFLVSLWMANGFISSDQTSDGENVVNELYWRSFFEDVERDEFGKITSFKLHDLTHDLAQSVAEDVCCITDDNGVTPFSKRIRHLSNFSIYSEKSSVAVKYLKTFIMQSEISVVPPHVLKCYSLRMLKIRGLQELPSAVGRLKYLSYLDISSGTFETLPESLWELLNLEILILDDCSSLKRLSDNLICLKSLQCLSLKGCDSLSSTPPQIGKLTCLKKISKYIVGKEEGFLLAELGQLKLEGKLEIEHLEKVKGVRDAEEANMRDKHLNDLRLSWDKNEECELQENVEEILNVLQPHCQQLLILYVAGYRGTLFPEWMSSPSLTNLHSLTLINCQRCLNLLQMGKLPSLKSLKVYGMDEVQYLENESYDGEGFIALESLELSWLAKLKKLSREDGANKFPRLSELEISNCPELLDLPCLPSLKNLKIFREWKEDLLSAFHKVPSLESLLLRDHGELTCFPDGMLGNLNSLKTLRISSFDKLESLTDEVFKGLESLQTLEISFCKELKLWTGFGHLTCLEHLEISFCPAVENLQLQDMTSLKSFILNDLPNLESLPDRFGNLPLLRQFRISHCPKLKCLPTSFQCLTSLETLTIDSCPELEKRCEKETGEDWPKIAHVSRIICFSHHTEEEIFMMMLNDIHDMLLQYSRGDFHDDA